MEYIQLLAGLAILVYSGKFLVKGGVDIASHFNISTLVVGVTVVAFGTSAPELLVSLNAALKGHPEIALGNVVGSNISNIALVLALAAIILPIPVKRNSIKTDWPIMMIASTLLFFFLFNNKLQFWEGLLFFVSLLCFLVWSVHQSRKEQKALSEDKESHSPIYLAIIMVLISSGGLALGADFLVEGASEIARNFGISERVISITIIAFGTSVPELTASIIAAMKKETDISIGNIIGSNIFNVFAVLGITSMVKEININFSDFSFDIIWMLAFSLLLFLFIFPSKPFWDFLKSMKREQFNVLMKIQGGKLKRWEGSMLLIGYIVYIILLFHR